MTASALRSLPLPPGARGYPIIGETGDWARDPLLFGRWDGTGLLGAEGDGGEDEEQRDDEECGKRVTVHDRSPVSRS